MDYWGGFRCVRQVDESNCYLRYVGPSLCLYAWSNPAVAACEILYWVLLKYVEKNSGLFKPGQK
jgi:hypothetical protein